MNLPVHFRRSPARLALIVTTFLSVAALQPLHALADQSGPHAELRAARLEERAKRSEERAARRALRLQEAQARRSARAQQRAARGTHGRPQSDGSTGETAPSSGETATMPQARAYRGCTVRIAVSAPQVIAGETVTLTGTLTCPGSAAAAQKLAILEREGGSTAGALRAAATVTTDTAGSFTMTSPALTRNTVFQARAGHHGAHAKVRVAPAVTLSVLPAAAQASSADASSHHTRAASSAFTGTVSPADVGALVALQVAYGASGAAWHSIAWGHVGADGSYSIAHVFRNPGEASLRTLVRSGRAKAVGVSEVISFAAAQSQNPQLTIESTADPLVAGQPVTISGAAAGPANQPVKLLARTAGGTFAPVAEGTTDASGNYSFTQTPLQNTLYRVTDAAAQSSVLFQEVAFALASSVPPGTVAPGQAVTFTGSVTPTGPGLPVRLEQRYPSGIGFHVVATGTLDTVSGYSIEHAFAGTGSVVVRISIPGGDGHETTTGPPYTITLAG
jgi:hypothetical protein